MNYEITVKQITRAEDKEGYIRESSVTIYEQRVEKIDLKRVIDAVNYEPPAMEKQKEPVA